MLDSSCPHHHSRNTKEATLHFLRRTTRYVQQRACRSPKQTPSEIRSHNQCKNAGSQLNSNKHGLLSNDKTGGVASPPTAGLRNPVSAVSVIYSVLERNKTPGVYSRLLTKGLWMKIISPSSAGLSSAAPQGPASEGSGRQDLSK